MAYNEGQPKSIAVPANRAPQSSRSRREVGFGLKALAIGLVVTGGLITSDRWGPKVVEEGRSVVERFSHKQDTQEQKKAEMLIGVADEMYTVTDIVIEGDNVGSEKYANARNRPSTQDNNGTFEGGENVDTIKPGLKVAKALVVSGNDPNTTMERAEKSKWLAFRDPNLGGKIVFVEMWNLDPDSILKVQSKTPIDLSKVSK